MKVKVYGVYQLYGDWKDTVSRVNTIRMEYGCFLLSSAYKTKSNDSLANSIAVTQNKPN